MTGGWDGHAHVWRQPLAFIPEARHRPDYDAPVEAYLAELDRHGLASGLLIQPSFLGADNSLMLEAVRRFPGRLKAVVMVDPATPDEELNALEVRGAVGVRFNLIGLPLPDFSREPHAGFVKRLAARKWHVELHREARDLPALLPPLLDSGVRIAVDHFGRPDPAALRDDPGFRYLLGVAATNRVWVKISAAYRSGGDAAARDLTPALLEHFGPQRLIWASDWPHTQHEAAVNYHSTYALFEAAIPDANIRQAILERAPAALLDVC